MWLVAGAWGVTLDACYSGGIWDVSMAMPACACPMLPLRRSTYKC